VSAKNSIKAVVRDAKREDARLRKSQGSLLGAATNDSFVNLAHKLGIGADNALTSGTYGYNPITRNRTLLEWIHRGSWLGGVAVDLIADDMTRAGVEILCEMKPEDTQAIARAATAMNIWPQINETIRWARLYGGCLGVLLVDGQDPKTPLRVETVGKDQFKGLLTLDRWMVEPSLGDLVTEYGPHLGLPSYYTVQSNAPALRGQSIHYSRVAFRLTGIELPYQQRLTENLWGISVLERLYDRMIAFDSATTGAAQLVFKSYLRTLKVEGMREIVAAGGAPLNGLMQYTEIMRRFQGIEGITLLDGSDEFEVQQTTGMAGIDDILMQLGQHLSGALQIPLVRLFGQSPAGLNSSGESDIRTYYDHIKQQQNKTLNTGTALTYRLIAQSNGIKPPDDFDMDFRSLWQLDDVQKADVANKIADAVTKAGDTLLGRQTSLKELRQSSRITGVFSNISQEAIDAADDEVLPPLAETAMQQEHEEGLLDKSHAHAAELADKGHEHALEMSNAKAKEKDDAGPKRAKGKVADGARRRVQLQY
jgi:phage-related protein (TIGR01555 family)